MSEVLWLSGAEYISESSRFLKMELSSKPDSESSSWTFLRNDKESSIEGSDIVYLNVRWSYLCTFRGLNLKLTWLV